MEAQNNPQENTQNIVVKKSSSRKHLIVGSIALVILVLAIFFITKNSMKSSSDDVAAKVNGQVISMSELDRAFNSLPAEYQAFMDKNTVLEQIIQSEVLYQEAKKKGIDVSEDEAKQEIQQLISSQGLTNEQYQQTLVQQKTTEDEFIKQYAKQLSIESFINETLLKNIVITDEEIKSYYDKNIEQFKVGEQVTAKHILIGDANLTKEQQKSKAVSLLKEIKTTNFCEYVNKYSTDLGSIQTCGEYTFTRTDPYVEEFKNLSFNQKAGDIGIADTQFGSHIIWTVKKTPARTMPLEEVKDQIRQYMQSQKAQEQYQTFYNEIKAGSQIEIIYLDVNKTSS